MNKLIVIKTARGTGKILHLEQALEEMKQKLEQVTLEREEAVNDLKLSAPCFACGHYHRNGGPCYGGLGGFGVYAGSCPDNDTCISRVSFF